MKKKKEEEKPKELVIVGKRKDGTVIRKKTGFTREELVHMVNVIKSSEAIIKKVKNELVGISSNIEDVCKMVFRASRNDNNVLILGETGTGKEIVARQIHEHSKRAKKPFVVLQPAGLPENLVDAELFGSTRHAYTDATDYCGLIEAANGGTLFIDEIADLPPSTQSKLLRSIQFKTYRRLGEVKEKPSDFRLICAANRPLLGSALTIPGFTLKESETTFRSDLYYRIAEVVIEISPLRERREDILPIFLHLIRRHFPEIDLRRLSMSWNDLYCLLMSDWHGNVRELENLIKRNPITQWKLEKETIYQPFPFLDRIRLSDRFQNDQYDISEPGNELSPGWGLEKINVVIFAKTLETLASQTKPPYWKMVKDRPLKSISDLVCFDVERVLVDEARKLEALPKYRERREEYQEKKELERVKKEREGLLASLGKSLGPDALKTLGPLRGLLASIGSSRSSQRLEDGQEGGDLFNLPHKEAKIEFEKEWLRRALERNDWSVPRTADEMKIRPQGLYKKLKKLNLRIPKKHP